MDIIYFNINGSSCPFWKDEKINSKGGIYYSDMYWPESLSDNLKKDWDRLLTLYFNFKNPIDSNFPSFWNKSMCDLFNNLTDEFFQKSLLELNGHKLIDRFEPLIESDKLWEYKLDPIKYHANLNKSIDDKDELKKYLDTKIELTSNLVNDIAKYKSFRISSIEFKAFNRLFLNFGGYKQFPISLCPFTNRTYLTIISFGGHGAVHLAVRIDRDDIFNNEEKLIELLNSYNQ